METYGTMNEMWHAALAELRSRGTPQPSRDGPTAEVVGWSARLRNPDANFLIDPARRLDPAYACAELLWYLSGQRTVEMMCAYAPGYRRFANPQEPTGIAHGAYGDRWRTNPGFVDWQEPLEDKGGIVVGNQLELAVEHLRRFPQSRQCVVTMWDSGDLGAATVAGWNDIPCTVCLQFVLRDDRLHATCYMRSNDVWLGLPYDVFCFTTIQRMVARRLGVRAGPYVHNVGSLHAYARDIPKLPAVGAAAGASVAGLLHGYDELYAADDKDGRWNAANAVAAEASARGRRERELKTGDAEKFVAGFGLGVRDPLADAALVCAARMRGNAFQLVSRVGSDVLRAAWDMKYNDGTPAAAAAGEVK